MSAAVQAVVAASEPPVEQDSIPVPLPSRPNDRRGTRPSVPSALILAVGLLVSAVLSWTCYAVNSRNESRLLTLQTKQAGTILQAALPTIQTPLASAAAIAATDGGDPAAFRSYIATYVGDQRPFVSASLWKLSAGRPALLASSGAAALLPAQADRMAAFLTEAVDTPKLSVTGLLDGPDYRLGYAFTPDGTTPSFAVYAEGALPAGRRAVIEAGSPFGNLRFALHLGHSTARNTMLETNASKLPLKGRTSTVEVPFGTETLTLVASSRSELGGNLSAWLWWIVAVAGILVTLAAALTSERLVRRRRRAERLAEQVEGLHRQQRSIAETLQHTLLPQKLPPIPGLDVAVRYIAGSDGMDIGGDWYDVIALDHDRFFFVIGDVSGRGVQAGSVMASLHYAIRAFVSENYSPVEVIQRLSAMLDVSRDGHFATVLCGVGDTRRHEVTVTNAGHLPLLLITDGGPRFLPGAVGPPIGVPAAANYQPVTLSVPPGATLLAYTDGLVERRGEIIDDGFSRLRQAASKPRQCVEDLVSELVDELATENHSDDTAVLGMRWLS